MEEGDADVVCFNCAAPCSASLGNYAPCDVCGVNPLCVACSITFDVAVCQTCAQQQHHAAKEKEAQLAARPACANCKNVWTTERCVSCNKHWCDVCFKKVGMHLCYKCVRCGVHTDRKCCGRRWCEDCLEGHHKKTDCRITLSYKCPTCADTVLQFGDAQFRCAIPNCKWKYACQHGNCSANIRSAEGLAYCQYHTSREICQGCGSRYGLNGLQGNLYIFQLLGNGRPCLPCCGNCRQRYRALVGGIRLMSRRAGYTVPKVVVDMLLCHLVKIKWHEWRQRSAVMVRNAGGLTFYSWK